MSEIKKQIAVLGCFRSGTNYSKTLLELNFNCNVKNNLFGWKHGFLPIVSSDSKITYETHYDAAYFVTKNPFSFLVSLHRYYNEAKLNINAHENFDDFVRGRIIIFDGGNPSSPQLRFSNPIDLWNAMNWNYQSQPALQHVRYEMLLKYPQATANKLANKLGIKRVSNDFLIPQKRVKRMNDRTEYANKAEMMTNQAFNKKQYLAEEYMQMFDTSLCDFVLEQLDHELVNLLGYEEIIGGLVCQESQLDEEST